MTCLSLTHDSLCEVITNKKAYSSRNFAVTYLHKIIAIYHSPKDADL